MVPQHSSLTVLAVLFLASSGAPVLTAQDCTPSLCNGAPPTVLTAALPEDHVGQDAVIGIQVRGNNPGTYYSYTDPTPNAPRSRNIHISLSTDGGSQAIREMEQHVGVTFGKCMVNGNVTTCYIAISGRTAGAAKVPIKVFDNCIHEDCPGEVSGKLHFSYTVREFAVNVSQ